MEPAAVLVVIAAGIVGALGTAHLFLTFKGPKLLPRDPAVREAMQQTHLVITRQTTMWKAWIGFNTTHSMGAMLFGVVYATLAIEAPAVLFRSVVLQAAGGLMVVGLVILAKRYFFITPLLGSTIAAVCYLAGIVLGGG